MNIQHEAMTIDPKEILFLKRHMPTGTYRTIANNLGIGRIKVMNELSTLKEEYDEAIIEEFRRVLAIRGYIYEQDK